MRHSKPFAPQRLLGAVLAALPIVMLSTPAQANDYPTADRVLYVQACMVEHPGTRFEMLSKCSCALDQLASVLPFSDFDTMLTATNAMSIGGERGNTIRDTEVMTDQIKRFRELQIKAKRGCFINVPDAPAR
jgi:hypothetical protein